jgi:hypothetical protein
MQQLETVISKLQNSFKDLYFNEKKHLYTVADKILPSVTGLVKYHAPMFDEHAKSESTAKRTGVSQEQVLQEWKDKRDSAAIHGTAVHTYAEKLLDDLTIKPKNNQQRAVREFLLHNLNSKYELLAAEIKMYSPTYGYAGTCDLLMWDIEKECVVLFDYKTNIQLDDQYGNLLHPFPYLPNTNFNKYQIQLSYYQLMLEEAGIEVQERYIIWLKKDGEYEIRSCTDFTQILKTYLT